MNKKYVNSANPLISILTPTYNRPDWLFLTLKSLVEQTYSKWECIVVNDAGIDVKYIVDKFNDKRIKYYVNDKNLNLAGTRNVALSHASGDYYVMLDDDDILYDECLEFRVNRIKKIGADIIYSRALRVFYEKVQNGYMAKGSTLYWDSRFDHDLILIQNCSPCNCLMWSKKAQEKGGLFDTSLTTSEDWSHSVEMSRYFDFYETKIIDCECSFRTDNTQMTGTRDGYTTHLPYLYKKWREYATPQNKQAVIESQNNALRARGLNPKDYDL